MRYPGPCPPFVFCSFCLSGAPTLLFVHCVLTYRNKKTTKGQREKKKKKKKRSVSLFLLLPAGVFVFSKESVHKLTLCCGQTRKVFCVVVGLCVCVRRCVLAFGCLPVFLPDHTRKSKPGWVPQKNNQPVTTASVAASA